MMNRPRSRWSAPLALVTGSALLLLAACSGQAGIDPAEVDVPTPLPEGINFEPDISTAEADDSCDPLASYDPGSITAEQAREQLDSDDHISIGISQSTNLMGYRDPVTNQLEGFDIEIAEAIITELLGADAQITWVPMTSREREDAVNNDRVDMVVRTMTMNCGRWENVEFSTEYYSAGQRLLVPKDAGIESAEELTADQTVCTGESSTSPSNIAAVTEAQPVTVPDFNDCLVLLQQGTVDAVSTDETILAGMAIQDPTIEVVGEPFSDEPYGIAFQKGNTDLARYVNGVLADMRSDGRWQDIYDKWLAPRLGDATPPAAKYQD
ncbi:glutamate ABC transporter substrate-binding protein [Glycomyces buryatensis]|uniref:Glutamate ABC transporter substrate-binding protein n=1 Tax=Glycomyces buryatensis TaxID=2570927 RepID=A0A4S8QDM9_9ACTN|nr:glutamate ABC transporter substrate-binding protein [Glycomyces buryatensis]THV42663.1 glutamate ABC transporter substrate-binding protein [Glycomyces buryatensis]